ncbi:MAG: transglycosylase domain-containing protein [Lachnospiraceae bacterium]
MNYGKKGVSEKQRTLNAKSSKWGKKITLIFLKVFLVVFLCVGIIGAFGAFGVIKGVIDTAPDISQMTVAPTRFSTFIYDSEGNQTAKLVASDSNRIPVTMDKIPENLANAFVAIEDARFYEHNGIDIKGIMRAFFVGLKNKGNFSEGASTITQQLLKNLVFTDWVSEDSFAEKLKRKIQEQYLAIELEKEMDKNTILVNYMNTINLGQNTLGVQAASLRYFNKQVYELNLSECAVIAGITQNPSKYNPITHPEENAKRRSKVLNNMLEQGYITQAEYDEALADDPYSRIKVNNEVVGDTTITSYSDDAVNEQVYADLIAAGYNDNQAYTLLYTGGLSIFSTQNPDIQAICDEIYSDEENYPASSKWQLEYALSITKANGEVEHHSSEMYRKYFRENGQKSFNLLYSTQEDAYAAIAEYQAAVLEPGDEILLETINFTPQPQVSITVADQSTGYVVAMVGGRGTKEGSLTLNRATSTTRPAGSTFKVLASFGPALDTGEFTLATVVNDAPFNYYDGSPVRNWYANSATPYRGLVNIRMGIYDSLNIVAVKTLTQITPQLGYEYLLKFGFTTLETAKEINGKIYSDIQQSLALGGLTTGVSNLELNAAYAAIANGGVYIEPKLYTKVVDNNGNVILDNTQSETRQVIKETTAFLLTSAMQDTVTRGTGTAVNFGGMAIAGKTGTTTDDLDVWFSGYTPYYTATTWTGYDQNNSKLSVDKAQLNLSKTMWKKVMEKIHEELPAKSFEMPAGIVQATVCSRSGKLPIAGLCDHTLNTEYFAEGTVPTESCNVHYQGSLCSYSHLPACATCPFKVEGVFELTPPEHPSLQSGSATLTSNIAEAAEAPVEGETGTTNYCPHNEAFMADPNAGTIISQQWAEMQQANQAAVAAQEAAQSTE